MAMPYHIIARTLLLLIALCLLSGSIAAQETRAGAEGSFSITQDTLPSGLTASTPTPALAVRNLSLNENAWQPVESFAEPVVGWEKIEIAQGDSLSSLLQERFIRPDPNSIGIVKYVNPNLVNVDQLLPQQELWLPKRTDQALWLEEEYALIANLEQRRQLREASADIADLQSRWQEIDYPALAPGVQPAEFENAVSNWLADVQMWRAQALVVEPQVWDQLAEESRDLRELLEQTLGGEAVLSAEAVAAIGSAARMVTFAGSASKVAEPLTAEIEVTIISSETGEQVLDHDVYFVPEGMYAYEGSHNYFGSPPMPISRSVLVKNYLLWARSSDGAASDTRRISASQLRTPPRRERVVLRVATGH